MWLSDFQSLEINLSQYQDRILGYFYPDSMWMLVDEEDKSRVYHLEIVEMETMIVTTLILLLFEVFSNSATDDMNFFAYIHLQTPDTFQIR